MAPKPSSLIAFVALGSNLGDARRNILIAFERLQSLSNALLRRSSLWETAPVDCPPGSPNFINAVAALEPRANETPQSLLAQLQALEKEIGRQPKKILNEPRVIDLDLIALGSEIIATPELTLPHPRAHLRRFVLQPMSELAPDFIFPGQDKTVAELLQGLKDSEELERRAQRGSHEKFLAAMAKVPNVPPMPGDEL